MAKTTEKEVNPAEIAMENAKAEIAKMLADAKAEIAEMKASATAQPVTVVSLEAKKKEEEKALEAEWAKLRERGEELVDIEIYGDNEREKGPVFVAVNGENCVIPRNVPVKVKRKFAEAYRNGRIQTANAKGKIGQVENKMIETH